MITRGHLKFHSTFGAANIPHAPKEVGVHIVDGFCNIMGHDEKQTITRIPCLLSRFLDKNVWSLHWRQTCPAIRAKPEFVFNKFQSVLSDLFVSYFPRNNDWWCVINRKKNSGDGHLRSITMTSVSSEQFFQECLSLSDLLQYQWSLDVNSSSKPWVVSPAGKPSIADLTAFILDVPDSQRLSQHQRELRDEKMSFRSMALSLVAQVGGVQNRTKSLYIVFYFKPHQTKLLIYHCIHSNSTNYWSLLPTGHFHLWSTIVDNSAATSSRWWRIATIEPICWGGRQTLF